MSLRHNPKSSIQKLKYPIAAIILAGWLGPLAFVSPLCGQEAQAAPRLSFTKVLPGSSPEFEHITLDSTGAATFDGRKLSDPAEPRSFKLSQATTQKFFTLAHALNDFKGVDLESHKNVANLGKKTFTYESGGQKNSAEFNYSTRREAQDLVDMFERLSAVEEHIKVLEYAAKYDPLDLPRELLLIQIDMNNKALLEPELMVPVLEEITKNSRYLHLAKARAQDILQRVQSSN